MAFWLQQAPIGKINSGRRLNIGLHQAATVRWSHDNWHTMRNLPTYDSGIGLHIAEIDTRALPVGTALEFTYRFASNSEWPGRNFRITVIE